MPATNVGRHAGGRSDLKVEPYGLQIPRSQRGGEIVEPMISTQWFVRMKPLAEPALAARALRGGSQIVPERFTKVYYHWMENIRDWCISRQLWWGHRIPAWHCADCGEITVARDDPDRCAHCGSGRIEQDPDVLDTWFSSGLWPFSTLGWPDETDDLRTYYPTTVMETGYDILFFWVARMIMMGLEFTGRLPFETVYLHGLIRDEQGRKMSKTLGNVIDPLALIDEYGADALRLTLLTGSTPGNDMNLSVPRVQANRNFANKLWNAGRLVIGALERLQGPAGPEAAPTLADEWIHARRRQVLREVGRLFDEYQYGEAGRQIYEFFWGDFADWYLEAAKLQLPDGGGRGLSTAHTLAVVFDTCLRLLHPFTPFVTEELWGKLRAALRAAPHVVNTEGWGPALIAASWPEPEPEAEVDAAALERFGGLQELVRVIRNARAEKGVPSGSRLPARFKIAEQAWLPGQAELLASFARLDPQRISFDAGSQTPPQGWMPLTAAGVEVYLSLAEGVNSDAERARIQAQLEGVVRQVERLEHLLAGPFAERAPAEVVELERRRLTQTTEEAARLEAQLEALEQVG